MKKKSLIIYFLLLIFVCSFLPLKADAKTSKNSNSLSDDYFSNHIKKYYSSNNDTKYGEHYIKMENKSVHEKTASGNIYEKGKILLDGVAKSASILPERFNSLESMKNAGVVDQGNKNTCWAFSACNVISFDMLNSNEFNYDSLNLSELQMAYFEYNRQDDPLHLTTGDTNGVTDTYLESGGNEMFNALVLASWQGIYDENNDPVKYSDVPQDGVSVMEALSKIDANDTLAHLQNSDWLSVEDTDEIKNAVRKYGAVAVSIDVPPNYTDYYNAETNAYYTTDYDDILGGHSVTLVGWDDNFKASNFKEGNQPQNDGAWIILNSWGSNRNLSDENGCFYLSYEDPKFKELDTVVTYDVEPIDNYDYNYQYDGTMNLGGLKDEGSLTAANIYEAKGDSAYENIEAVGVGIFTTNTNVKVEIYKNITDTTNPLSGSLVKEATTQQKISTGGFHTIKLKNPVNIKHGEKYSVVVTLSKSGYEDNEVEFILSSTEDGSWYHTYNNTAKNQSFVYDNGTFYDLIKEDGFESYSFRIKAYTKKAVEEEHDYVTKITKATVSKDGLIEEVCSLCGDVKSSTKINKISKINLSKSSYICTGKAIKPQVTVKDSAGKTINSKYYTLSYKSNKNVGTGSVTITFKTYYSGKVTKSFSILPKSTSIKKLSALNKGFKLALNKQVSQTSGYQIIYSTSKNFSKNNKYVTISKNTTLSKTISKLKAKTTYYVKVRTYKKVNKKNYYSAWSLVKKVKTK
ncbi:Cysteine protease, C1A family [Acetitomaculum ruminis DSM 5522]|uniref:Cysteine protease, C1A family n=1 Tax=Acetitomaculum ruminis DSM 5522 TaxID=1120918 RepID=A0A1I0YT29_9FIRM|nr:lectin like domain-containing protein [Acetitomaculum ruminis]SFB16361.1 Cysteine protease, C1A family [Acetitomaculum ruminis DSM 5522]